MVCLIVVAVFVPTRSLYYFVRDTLGNQMVSELLVKNIARRGYMLAIDKNVIRVI